MKNASRKYMFIVNPVSANGTTGTLWNEFKEGLEAKLGTIDWAMTKAPKHATELCRKALEEGYDTIVSVGGDGTMNEVANGFFDRDGNNTHFDARLAVFSRGTGCDFIRSLGQKKELVDVIEVLTRDQEKIIDGCWVKASDTMGEKRYFLNIADCGIGGATTLRVNQKSKVLKGFLSFLIGALYTLATYQDKETRVFVDGKEVFSGLLNSVIVANGKYFGGGMKVAPNAVMDDGRFDIVMIHHMSRLNLFRSFPSIYNGDHLKNPNCSFLNGTSVRVETRTDHMLTEIDGEQVGTTDAEFGILPSAIKLLI